MDWFSEQLHLLRLKAVNVERERAVSSQNGGRSEEEKDDEEEDSDREETEVQKKQESSYEAAGDSDQEAVGLPSEGEEGEGEDGEKEEEEPVEQMALDKDRVNVRIAALEVCWSTRALTVCRKLLVGVQQLWTTATMQRMDSTACLL